jgi:hypothetical protein
MPETLSIKDRIGSILAELHGKLDGADSIFLVDLNIPEALVAYPQEESQKHDFVSVILGTITNQFEDKAQDLKGKLSLEYLEVQTEEGLKIYSYRILPEFLLCIVGDARLFKTGFAKRLCENAVKKDIVTALERAGINTTAPRR